MRTLKFMIPTSLKDIFSECLIILIWPIMIFLQLITILFTGLHLSITSIY